MTQAPQHSQRPDRARRRLARATAMLGDGGPAMDMARERRRLAGIPAPTEDLNKNTSQRLSNKRKQLLIQ